jgi:hypothetical protein
MCVSRKVARRRQLLNKQQLQSSTLYTGTSLTLLQNFTKNS